MRRARLLAVVLALVAAACGDGQTGSTTTTTEVVTTSIATTSLPTTTTSPPSGNPWVALLGRVSAPSRWIVEPCEGDAPDLCVTHDGLTSRIELQIVPLQESGFDTLLTAAGAPPALGDAGAHPSITTALRALAEDIQARYAETMETSFPDGVAVFDAPVVVPVGRIHGVRAGSRIETTDGQIAAASVRYLAFDGAALWQVVAEFDPRSEQGVTDIDTLLEFEPHLTLIVRDLAVQPALPGTETVVLELPAVGDLAGTWREILTIPYGEAEELLGTTPGGEGGQWQLGPEFGAQASDGTWWFADAAKRRLAHYSADGTFLGALAVPAEHLIRGDLFPWRLPHILDDGTIVMIQLESGDTTLLMVRNGQFSARRLGEQVNVKIDDGVALYGLTSSGTVVRIDPAAGVVQPVDWFETRAGIRFDLWVTANVVTLWLPDAPTPNITQLELEHAPDPGDRVYAGIEATGSADGTLHLFLLGGTDSGEGGQLGGVVNIGPEGSVSSVEITRGPDLESDPGSPAHLGVSPVTGRPWLMFVDPDGVHVFERSG